MSKAITKNELITLNSELSAKVAALGTRVVDQEKEISALRAQIERMDAVSKRFDHGAHISVVRTQAQALVAQYGAQNVICVGSEFRVRTPNGAWQPVS